MSRARPQLPRWHTEAAKLVKVKGTERAALLAWSDLDRFELVDVPLDEEKGRAAVGSLTTAEMPGTWPPRPGVEPRDPSKFSQVTRVFVDCRSVSDFEDMLEEIFKEDLAFLQTGLRPSRGPSHPGRRGGRRALTSRASFVVDATGRPVSTSMSYTPLIDFARHVRDHSKDGPLKAVIARGLERLDNFEEEIHRRWDDVAAKSGRLEMVAAVVAHINAITDGNQNAVHRYIAKWLPPDQEPAGQLPAFYRADLLAAAHRPTSPLLRDYLYGRPGQQPPVVIDVRQSSSVSKLLEPAVLPRAAWPSGHLPRLSQQIALAAIINGKDKVTAVNGPPGTGKTTLLRDVYANVVTERARAMVTFDDPLRAFGPETRVASADGEARRYYLPDTTLCGFEMLVASSNNAAVENVSKELPDLAQIGSEFRASLSYFRSAAEGDPETTESQEPRRPPLMDSSGGNSTHANTRPVRRRPGLLAEGRQPWGFAAAVLGSRDRVSTFATIVGRYKGASAPGNHLLGMLRGQPDLSHWDLARADFRAAHRAVEDRLAEIEEHRTSPRKGIAAQVATATRRRFRGEPPAQRAMDPATWVDDPRWWQRSAAERELGTAWVDPELQKLRSKLFVAAMRVHEEFVRRAGQPIARNLRLWLSLQTNDVRPTDAAKAALPAWQSFFILVPLASTTFASMARLMAHIPPGSLGWLIVDEAGQATPGSAVGGLARFRRAVIVGDPQQLEPVVTLPRLLVDRLTENRGSPPELAPHRSSVQLLADAVSTLGTVRSGSWVGSPLLVHNRCQEPMFGIANEMAYDGDMVQGRTGGAACAAQPLGPSRWIDVHHTDGSHFQEQDWPALRALIRAIPWDSGPLPTIAIISPFREVVRGVAPLIADEITEHLPRGAPRQEVDQALSQVGVGTVHTFQGREYEAVVLILGGGSLGARQWAAQTPNLLNVAVTRSKDRLYVIGDHRKWKQVGHAAQLALLDISVD